MIFDADADADAVAAVDIGVVAVDDVAVAVAVAVVVAVEDGVEDGGFVDCGWNSRRMIHHFLNLNCACRMILDFVDLHLKQCFG